MGEGFQVREESLSPKAQEIGEGSSCRSQKVVGRTNGPHIVREIGQISEFSGLLALPVITRDGDEIQAQSTRPLVKVHYFT